MLSVVLQPLHRHDVCLPAGTGRRLLQHSGHMTHTCIVVVVVVALDHSGHTHITWVVVIKCCDSNSSSRTVCVWVCLWYVSACLLVHTDLCSDRHSLSQRCSKCSSHGSLQVLPGKCGNVKLSSCGGV